MVTFLPPRTDQTVTPGLAGEFVNGKTLPNIIRLIACSVAPNCLGLRIQEKDKMKMAASNTRCSVHVQGEKERCRAGSFLSQVPFGYPPSARPIRSSDVVGIYRPPPQVVPCPADSSSQSQSKEVAKSLDTLQQYVTDQAAPRGLKYAQREGRQAEAGLAAERIPPQRYEFLQKPKSLLCTRLLLTLTHLRCGAPNGVCVRRTLMSRVRSSAQESAGVVRIVGTRPWVFATCKIFHHLRYHVPGAWRAVLSHSLEQQDRLSRSETEGTGKDHSSFRAYIHCASHLGGGWAMISWDGHRKPHPDRTLAEHVATTRAPPHHGTAAALDGRVSCVPPCCCQPRSQ